MLPIYNRNGIKITTRGRITPGSTPVQLICRANIPGTAEHAESQKAYKEIMEFLTAPSDPWKFKAAKLRKRV
jgi:hypothetical protein